MSLFIDKTADDSFVRTMEKEYFLEPGEGKLSRYFVDEKGDLKLVNSDTPCPQDAKFPIVTSDGDVAECCYDIFQSHVFGNCENERFTDIWNKKEYRDFRKNVMMPRKLPICKNCMPKYAEWKHRIY